MRFIDSVPQQRSSGGTPCGFPCFRTRLRRADIRPGYAQNFSKRLSVRALLRSKPNPDTCGSELNDDSESCAGMLLAAWLFSLLTIILPAWQASRIYPAEAVRYE